MLYVVKVGTHAGDFYLHRGELGPLESASYYDSPSAAFRAVIAYRESHPIKSGTRLEVIRARDLPRPPQA